MTHPVSVKQHFRYLSAIIFSLFIDPLAQLKSSKTNLPLLLSLSLVSTHSSPMAPTLNLHPNLDNSEVITITHADCSFISRALLSSLLSSNPKPTIRTVPIWTLNPSELRSTIDGSDTVFHVDPTLGASDGGHLAEGDEGWYEKYKMIVEGTRDVVRVCLECGVKRLVYCGSADVVFDGVCDVVNGNEDLEYPDKFLNAINDLRAQAEMLVLNANGKDGLSTCVLRISNPFGPGDNHIVPFLVGKAKSTWSKFIIGSGTNYCDFTYVDNVVHACLCAEQALCPEASSVAGKPFFITNHEPMMFWDFNANVLEGLGYRRPIIHLPVRLALVLAILAEWICGKLHVGKTCGLFVAPTIHNLSCTRTFDSSKAQKIIKYSPVVSLEDGISETVKSFLLKEMNSPHPKQGSVKLKQSKAELFLGSGKVAEILLWKDEKRTFTCVMGLFLLFHWLFFSGRNFITSVANLLMLVSTILFCYGYLPSSMMGHKIVKIPSSSYEIPEYAVKQPLLILASTWNKSLLILESMSQEGNWDVFLKVVGSLCFIKLLLAFSFSTLLVLAVVCLFSFFIIYEQCEEEIEKLANISSSSLTKSKEFLSAKLSSLNATVCS